MKRLILATLGLTLMAGAALADPLEGLWQTTPDENGNTGLIEVVSCGAALCGTLIKAFGSAGEEIPSDNVGRQLIWDTVPDGEGQYAGRIYSPAADAEYASKLVLTGDSLSVSGCRLGFCREGGVWSRAN